MVSKEVPPGTEPESDDDALDPGRSKKDSSLASDISRVVAMVLIFTAMIYVLRHYIDVDVDEWRRRLHAGDTFRERIQSYLIFVFAGGLLIAVGVPRVAICAIGGAAYGAYLGAVISLLASVLGSLGPYQIGKSILRGTMKRRLGKRFNIWKDRFRSRGFAWTLNLRLLPVANATVTGLICGACKVGVFDYLAATAIGAIPQTVIFTMFGSGAAKGKYDQIVIGLLIFVVVALAQWQYARRSKRKKRLEAI